MGKITTTLGSTNYQGKRKSLKDMKQGIKKGAKQQNNKSFIKKAKKMEIKVTLPS